MAISCAFGSSGNPNSLQLNDSTISGNRGGGGTAGIWGEPNDQLTLQNSILNGDSDGVELTGFSSGGGSATATFTNLCSGASPFIGTGNICADPRLVGASSGDVHETFSSPTVDAGSNALVPNGLTTDVHGNTRIQPRLAGGTATVDMGAAELNTVPAPSASITTPASGATYSQGQTVSASFNLHQGQRWPRGLLVHKPERPCLGRVGRYRERRHPHVYRDGDEWRRAGRHRKRELHGVRRSVGIDHDPEARRPVRVRAKDAGELQVYRGR